MDAEGQDFLDDDNFAELCLCAILGYLAAIIGGPMCRTWSLLRHFWKPNAPRPVRDRFGNGVWGKSGNTPAEQDLVDYDSLLLLRMLFLYVLAVEAGHDPAIVLEHPADPFETSKAKEAEVCPSIWATPQLLALMKSYLLTLVTFHQCMLGGLVEKATSVMSNLDLAKLDNLCCNHPGGHTYSGSSKGLSRWAYGLCLSISLSLNLFLQGVNPTTSDRPIPQACAAVDIQASEVVTLGNKSRPLRDGAGKPSLGRKSPQHRPKPKLRRIGEILLSMAMTQFQTQPSWDLPSSFSERSQVSPWELLEYAVQHPCKGHPLPTEMSQSLRTTLVNKLIQDHVHQGWSEKDLCHQAEGQPFYLNLLSAIATLAGDVDRDFPRQIEKGVPLGVTGPVLEDQGVWPTKAELGEEVNLDQVPTPFAAVNYPSAEVFEDAIEATFLEEAKLNMVLGPFTINEAAEVCGCTISELCIGALAAIDEGDKIRTIFDATITEVNNWIRKRMTRKTTAPGLHDLLWAKMRCSQLWPQKRLTLFKSDVSKAHRRIKVDPKDWKYMVAKIKGKYWVNCVGTYGVASAQWYWGRLASLLSRLVYHLSEEFLWVLVFVDDYMLLLEEDNPWKCIVQFLLFMDIVGCPISWQKNVLGAFNTWLGYLVDINRAIPSIPSSKLEMVLPLMENMAAGNCLTAKQVESALGRLQWMAKAFPCITPFLQPMYSWFMRVTRAAEPSWLLRFLAKMVMELLEAPNVPLFMPNAPVLAFGASDAGATDKKATIGGWFSQKRNSCKGEVLWYAIDLTDQSASWAFDKKSFKKRIAALELLGTIVLIRLMVRCFRSSVPNVQLPLRTDNLGNAFAIGKSYSKKWPNSALLMELECIKHRFGLRTHISHVKRESNTWADQLTHLDFDGFEPSLRLATNLKDVPKWLVFDKLQELYHRSASCPVASGADGKRHKTDGQS